MPYLKCDCGEQIHIFNAYLPEPGESGPVVCPHCSKEWTVSTNTHGGMEVEPAVKASPKQAAAESQPEPDAAPPPPAEAGSLMDAALDDED
jgi:hypothetical protein